MRAYMGSRNMAPLTSDPWH